MKRVKHNLNLEINEHRIEDVAEKVGSIFGEKGRAIGKSIDDLTKNVTIKINVKDNVGRGGKV